MSLALVDTGLPGRDKAIARISFGPGQIILAEPAWCTNLLPSMKGQRCDHCHRAASNTLTLRKCAQCAGYWYCGTECQNAQWKLHHKTICKRYNVMIASPQYQPDNEYNKTDSILLAYVMSLLSWGDVNGLPKSTRELASMHVERPGAVFMDLLKHPNSMAEEDVSDNEIQPKAVWSRFRPNNFIVTSHLNPGFAHGVFPLASRLFNHSCTPNAAPRFILEEGHVPRMEIVALRDVAIGDEVTITYVDPATPYAERSSSLSVNYGFKCACPLCTNAQRRGWVDENTMTPPPDTLMGLKIFGRAVEQFALGETLSREPLFESVPESLAGAMHPAYLPALSEAFSISSHDGPLYDALDVGRNLLAMYKVVYPAMYPLIGHHALELAKVAWNSVCLGPESSGDDKDEHEINMTKLAREYIDIATTILNVFGEEGDAGGPLAELRTLQMVMSE